MFKLAAHGAIEGILTDAGFSNVARETLIVDFNYESVEKFVSFTQDVAAPIRLMLAERPPEKADEVWEAIAAAAGEHVADDGRVHLPSETIIVSGRK